MPRVISRSVRFAFLALAGVLLVLAGVESVAGGEERMGLTACGWEENPCVMEELVVKAPPAAEPVAGVARAVEHVESAQPQALRAQS